MLRILWPLVLLPGGLAPHPDPVRPYLPELGDPTCWDMNYRYATCCTGFRTDCFSGQFTEEKCCARAWKQVWRGRPSCFSYTSVTYEECCLTGDKCGPGSYPARCCGLRRMLQQAQEAFEAAIQLVTGHQHHLVLLILSLPGLWSLFRGAEEQVSSSRRSNQTSTILRAQAALVTLPFHSLLDRDPIWAHYFMETARCHNYLWFVVSSHLTLKQQLLKPLPKERPLRAALLNISAALMRRCARLIPLFVFAQLLFPHFSAIDAVQRQLYPGLQDLPPTGPWHYLSPGYWLFSSRWIYKVEFLCSAAVLCLAQVALALGQPAALALAVAGLAYGQQARPHYPHSIRGIPIHFHFQLASGNLPLCLWTLIFSFLLPSPDDGKKPRPWRRAGVFCFMQLCILVTGFLEWCFYVGHFDPLPGWPLPIFVDMPLVFGCTLALATLPQQDDVPLWSAALYYVDPLFAAWNIFSSEVYGKMLRSAPPYLSNSYRLMAEIPAWAFWALLFSALAQWFTEPYQRLALRAVKRLEGQAASDGWRGLLALLALVGPSLFVTWHYFREL